MDPRPTFSHSDHRRIRQSLDVDHDRWGSPDVNDWRRDAIDLRNAIRELKPADVELAGNAFKRVAERMDYSIGLMVSMAQFLSESWGGPGAEAAMKHLQRIYDNAKAIRYTSDKSGDALKDHAEVQLVWKRHERDWPPLYDSEVAHNPHSREEAQERHRQVRLLMRGLQSTTAASNRKFPDGIRIGRPDAEDGGGGDGGVDLAGFGLAGGRGSSGPVGGISSDGNVVPGGTEGGALGARGPAGGRPRTRQGAKPEEGAGGKPGGESGEPTEVEHERTYWLPEDKDTWDGDDGAVQPVIG